MTLYPNWLYYEDYFLNLGTVQSSYLMNSSKVDNYISSEGGRLKTFTRSKSLPVRQFECTALDENYRDIERILEYLNGKTVLLGYGPRDLATYGVIQNFNVPSGVSTVQKYTIDIQFLGNVMGQFREAEDLRNFVMGTTMTDVAASGGQALNMSTSIKFVGFNIYQSDIVLPIGDYSFFVRARDTAQVTDDLCVEIKNQTDSIVIVSDNTTCTQEYKLHQFDFSITSVDIGDTISLSLGKSSSTVNNIYIDFLGFAAKP